MLGKNLFFTALAVTGAVVGALYVFGRKYLSSENDKKNDIIDIDSNENDNHNENIPIGLLSEKSNIERVVEFPKQERNLFEKEVENTIQNFFDAIKNYDFDKLKLAIPSRLYENFADDMDTVTSINNFFTLYENILLRIFFPDNSKYHKLDRNLFKGFKILNIENFSSWIDKLEISDLKNVSIKLLGLQGNIEDYTIAEYELYYDDTTITLLSFLKYDDYHVLKSEHLFNSDFKRLEEKLNDGVTYYYSTISEKIIKNDIISKADSEHIFINYKVNGILSSEIDKTNLVGINISTERLQSISDNVRTKIDILIRVMEKHNQVWAIKYINGKPIQIYIARNSKSEFVGGCNIDGSKLKGKTFGGIWSLLD